MKLITALILSVTALTAQAAEINLECSYIGVDKSIQTASAVFDPELKSGSFNKMTVNVQTAGSNYILVEPRIGVTYTVNRESLALTIQAFSNTLSGNCKVATSKNKI